MTGRREHADRRRALLPGHAERCRRRPFHYNRRRSGADASAGGGRLNEQTLAEASNMATRSAHGRPGVRPPQSSRLFRGAGNAILCGPGPAGLAAVLSFGAYGGFHGHFDKLSCVFFGLGEELGVDPGRARSQTYRLPIHTSWYKATLGHNAVLVDGRSQQPAQGRCLLFDAGQGPALAAAAGDSATKESSTPACSA